MRLTVSLLLCSALAACAAPGATTPPAPAPSETASGARACFQGSRVRNFSTPRHDTLMVRSMENRVFELTSLGACADLVGAIQLGIDTDTSAGMSLCPGDIARVTVSQAGDRQLCRMRVSRVLSEAEVEALPRRDRP